MTTAPTGASSKAVFIADDTAFVRDRFQLALRAAGHQAITAGTGPDLLDKLRQHHGTVDLVLIDLRLRQGKGLGLVRAVQKLPMKPAAIVVFSGTIGSAAEVREMALLGVSGYVNEYASDHHIVPALTPHLFSESANRRTSPRITIGVPVAYRLGNTIAAAVTLSLSRSGLAIRTTSLLDVGTAIKVRFRVPGGTRDVESAATVVWTDRRIGMGLQFSTLAVEDERLVSNFVESHFFSNRKA